MVHFRYELPDVVDAFTVVWLWLSMTGNFAFGKG